MKYRFKGRRVDASGKPYYIWIAHDPKYSYATTRIFCQFVDEFWRGNE